MTGTEDRTLTCPVSAPASPPDGHTGAPRPSGPTHSPQAATGPHSTTPPFTAQDLALVALIAEGHGNRAIGAKLDLPLGTLKRRIEQLTRRHHTCSRTGLVGVACRAGQLGPASTEPPALPYRLREILPGMAAGWNGPRIGRSLHLSAGAVKTREGQLFVLLGASGRANAVWLAWRAGLLPEATR